MSNFERDMAVQAQTASRIVFDCFADLGLEEAQELAEHLSRATAGFNPCGEVYLKVVVVKE